MSDGSGSGGDSGDGGGVSSSDGSGSGGMAGGANGDPSSGADVSGGQGGFNSPDGSDPGGYNGGGGVTAGGFFGGMISVGKGAAGLGMVTGNPGLSAAGGLLGALGSLGNMAADAVGGFNLGSSPPGQSSVSSDVAGGTGGNYLDRPLGTNANFDIIKSIGPRENLRDRSEAIGPVNDYLNDGTAKPINVQAPIQKMPEVKNDGKDVVPIYIQNSSLADAPKSTTNYLPLIITAIAAMGVFNG